MMAMKRKTFIEQIITGNGCIERKGEYLIDHAKPLYCAEILMRSIADNIKEQCELSSSESIDEAIQNFTLGREYIEILDFLMKQMVKEVLPAMKRLHLLQHPEEDRLDDEEEEKEK